MKADIHPKYFPNAVIACACGAQYKTGSTQERIEIELCAACHPFFTGKQKIIDSARRVEKFGTRTEAKSVTVKNAADKAADRVVRAKAKEAKRAARDTSIKSTRV
ncbi:MAG: 50S ribosomal protein L31 [Patescibacteria group bacterium]|jgi:large subunit ribosomal protein L31